MNFFQNCYKIYLSVFCCKVFNSVKRSKFNREINLKIKITIMCNKYNNRNKDKLIMMYYIILWSINNRFYASGYSNKKQKIIIIIINITATENSFSTGQNSHVTARAFAPWRLPFHNSFFESYPLNPTFPHFLAKNHYMLRYKLMNNYTRYSTWNSYGKCRIGIEEKKMIRIFNKLFEEKKMIRIFNKLLKINC